MENPWLHHPIPGVFLTLLSLLLWLLALLAASAVAGVLAVLLGYMTLMGTSLSVTTLAMLVVCAGFCVDYITHVRFLAISGPRLETWTARMAL